jgi:hypothetical protein
MTIKKTERKMQYNDEATGDSMVCHRKVSATPSTGGKETGR